VTRWPGWDQTPSFPDIAGSADSADTDCTLDGSSYGTSCATWLADIGQAVGQLAKPMIFTFAHEFNVSGQYPFSRTNQCDECLITDRRVIERAVRLFRRRLGAISVPAPGRAGSGRVRRGDG
jgi:hypothetical protein